MAITKQFSKTKSVCKVTFSIAAEAIENTKNVTLLGEFNNWNPETATVLKKQKDGSFKAAVELEAGKEYQFRYLLDGSVWTNDSAADKYISNGISLDENSVVVL